MAREMLSERAWSSAATRHTSLHEPTSGARHARAGARGHTALRQGAIRRGRCQPPVRGTRAGPPDVSVPLRGRRTRDRAGAPPSPRNRLAHGIQDSQWPELGGPRRQRRARCHARRGHADVGLSPVRPLDVAFQFVAPEILRVTVRVNGTAANATHSNVSITESFVDGGEHIYGLFEAAWPRRTSTGFYSRERGLDNRGVEADLLGNGMHKWFDGMRYSSARAPIYRRQPATGSTCRRCGRDTIGWLSISKRALNSTIPSSPIS